jgi:hypothetical protein
MNNKLYLLVITAFITAMTACSINLGGTNATSNANQAANTGKPVTANSTNPANTAAPTPASNVPVKIAGSCPEQKQPGKRFIKAQTFPIDFKPYGGACFVTFGNTADMLDEKDIPRGSTFYVYKNGKQIFEFPDAFGGQPACWIEGVSFKDLNGDGLTDAVLAGSCLAAKDSYPSNAVYVNTGSEFTTNDEANAKLERFRSIKEIEAYVRKNVDSFF